MTLKEFSHEYAIFLNSVIEASHNHRNPKIDANYDDYQYRTINPITGSVFYYFFSANRVRWNLATMILSAARYPNEKIRKAYLRFFDASRF